MAKSKHTQKAERESLNIKDKLLEALKASTPEVFAEGKVNWDKVRLALGEHLDASSEKFNFTWAGKAGAVTNVLIPSKATLRPAKKESVKFDTSENLFIEGDNLEVLKLLQKSYFEQVKMIYIDPPYNTGNDFVYKDDFRQPLKNYLEQSGQVDSEGNRLSTNTQASGRFHSDWLTMMYPRLKLAWNLLRHDGVIFVSIDDNEVHHLRMMMDEIFGEENFVTEIIIQSNKRGQTYKQVAKTHEYCLVYSKTEETKISELDKGSENDLIFEDDISSFNIRELRNRNPKFGKHNRPNLFYEFYVNPSIKDKDGFSPIALNKNNSYRVKILPFNSVGKESCWRWGHVLALKNISENTIKSNLVAKEKREGGFNIYEKYRKTTYKTKSIWSDIEVISEQGTVELGKIELSKYFDFPKPLGLIKRIVQIGLDSEGIILDFFAGSATTAHAVLAQNQEDGGNRKFIMVQMPETTDPKSEAYKAGYKTIADIAKERIRRVLKGYGDHKPQGNGLASFSQSHKPQGNGLASFSQSHKPIDDGFKVFKLGKSNYTDNLFEYDPDKSPEENDKAFKDYLNKSQKELFPAKINELDIIYENIIKEGISLNAKIEEIKIGNNKVYKIKDAGCHCEEFAEGETTKQSNAQRLPRPFGARNDGCKDSLVITESPWREILVCLDEKLSAGAIEALTGKTYKEKIFICFDGGLDDTAKANLSLNLTLKTI